MLYSIVNLQPTRPHVAWERNVTPFGSSTTYFQSPTSISSSERAPEASRRCTCWHPATRSRTWHPKGPKALPRPFSKRHSPWAQQSEALEEMETCLQSKQSKQDLHF